MIIVVQTRPGTVKVAPVLILRTRIEILKKIIYTILLVYNINSHNK